MDPEAFLDLANQVTKLKMYPYFEIAHCILACLYVREDLGSGAHLFSRKHPFACWISSMMSIFSGGLLVSALLGEPILAVFKTHNQIILATVVWYMIFYSPFDVVYKICKFLPVKLAICALKEVLRCKKVHDGVTHAAKIYPNGFLIMVIVGTIKGNGAAFTKVFERLLRGVWTPASIEFMQPSFATKASAIASIIFVVDKKTELISAPHSLVYFGIVIFFLYFKVSAILLGIHDPFVPFENLFCAVFMGGLWDALSRAIGGGSGGAGGKGGAETSSKVDSAKNDVAKKKD